VPLCRPSSVAVGALTLFFVPTGTLSIIYSVNLINLRKLQSTFVTFLVTTVLCAGMGAIRPQAVSAAIGSDLNFQALSFQPEADLFRASSDLSPGFSRRYENVATIGGSVIDARVTIVAQSGNVNNELSTFDQYDNTQHLSAHTEPSGSAESSGKFRIDFLADGTDTPTVLRNIRASIADIDAHEFGTFFGISRYRLATGTQLSRSGSTAGIYRFHSSTSGTSNTDELRILEVDYDATSSITTEFGCRSNANGIIGAGGKCGFTVVVGTPVRTLGVVETAVARPTYTVTYNSNGGTSGAVPPSSTGTGEITITANTGALSKSPGVFLGWNTLANGTGVAFPPGYTFVPTENVTLYAQYGPASSPPAADNETSSGLVDVNQLINVLVGDTAGTGAFLNPSSIRFCAIGTPDVSCTSTSLLVANEGTYSVDQQTGDVTFDPLPSFSGPATPIKYVVADSTGQIASATIAVTVVSPSAPPYDLSYDLGGGTGTTPTTVTGLNQGDTTTLANDTGFTKTGFTFTGWNCNNSIGAKAAGTPATQPAANVVCTAQWAAVTVAPTTNYQLSYDLGGGTGTTPTTVTGLNQGDTTTLANDTGFTKTGFTFTGWNCDNSIGAKAAGTPATQPAANVVCTAQWAAVTVAPTTNYQLSYDLGGGTGTTPTTVTGLNQGDTTTLANDTGFTKTGFTFTGWNCNNSIGAKAAGTPATQPAANVVCTAQWAAVTVAPTTNYQLSYDLGGGTGTTPTTVTGLNQGDTTTLANDTGFTKTGFTFTGWNCNNSIGAKAAGTPATQPAANVVCTAQWAAVTSTLSPLPTTGLNTNLGLQIAILVLMVGFVLLLLSHRFQRRWL
jgi:uncharacterized repeat protein (TIGR02543 family)